MDKAARAALLTAKGMDKKSENIADYVADLLRQGRAKEVTDDLMAQADPQRLHHHYTTGNTGMDLPMDQASRMARAAQMGFRDKSYHGTGKEFQAFSDKNLGEKTGSFSSKFGHFTTSDPSVASNFGASGSVMPVMTKDGRYVDAGALAEKSKTPYKNRYGEEVTDKNGKAIYPWETDPHDAIFDQMKSGSAAEDPRSYVEQRKAAGISGFDIPGTFYDANQSSWHGYPEAHDVKVTFDPTNIRSQFARFDPRLDHLAHLSASTGGAMDFARHVEAVQRAGGQIAPSKYLPNVPRQVHAGGGKVAYHATHEPFEDYDWSRLGQSTKENTSGTSVDDWASSLASLGPWSHEKPLSKRLGMKTDLPVTLTGKEKKFKSLDHLAQEISQHGGPAALREKLVSQGYGHASVDDEEFGGKSYVGLSPEHFKITKAGGGRIGYGNGGMTEEEMKAYMAQYAPTDAGAELQATLDSVSKAGRIGKLAGRATGIPMAGLFGRHLGEAYAISRLNKAEGGNVEGDNGHIYVVHGGSDFDQIDPSYSGRGEPGNIRPLGKGLYGYVLDHTDPESAENAIGWATRYSQKYGGGKKALHVYKIPKSSSTVFNGQREINAEGYPKPIKGLGLEPQEKMAAYMAHRATEPPHTDPAWWDWSRKGSALYKDFKDAADLRMEHLPIGLTEVAIQNPKVATRIGKFSLDTPTSDILDAVKGDVQGGNITKAGGGAITVQSKDGSGIFGDGAMIHRYVHPETGSHIEILERRNGPASVLGLEVPEEHRGKGIGQMLQAEAMARHPALMGQVSSKAAATTAYRLGRRPYSAPEASLNDVFSAIDRDSSVNMLSPQAQPKAGGGEVDDDGITAYHGSPHSFDQFDISKLGTGEGAQAYGHGLYFAGNENVAKYYRDALTDTEQTPLHFDQRPVNTPWNEEIRARWPEHFAGKSQRDQDAMEEALGNLSQVNNFNDVPNALGNMSAAAKYMYQRHIKPKLTKPDLGKGHMYKVKLNVKPEELLDWDKPLSEQHPELQQKMRAILKPVDDADWENWKKGTGQRIHRTMGYPDDVAKELYAGGIKGIRYLDASSRGNDTDGDPTHNYVMFHHDPVQVTDKYEYGGVVGKAGGGEMEGVEVNNQNGVSNVGTQNQVGIAPFNPAPRAQAGELPNAGGVRGGSGVLSAPHEAPLEGLLTPVKIPMTGQVIHAGPDPRVRQVARDYMASTGMAYNPPKKYARVDPSRSERISDAYEAMKDNSSDPLTKASYDAMIKETMAQYRAAKAAGFKAEFWNPQTEEDPYHASPRLATEDIRNNHHMFVYPTEDGYGSDGPITEEQIKKNPMLQPSGETWNGIPVTVNDIFRAVHDYFGHAKEGVGFRDDGEENAWRAHASMFSPLARMAMTTETRGQNSWLNYNPVSGEKNRKARTEDSTFATQKVGVLPHWVHHEGAEDFMGPEEVNAMAAIRKVHGRATGGSVDDDNPAPVIQNPMSIFPKPQRMFPEDQRPKGGQYISTHNKADVTGHKAEAATIGIGPNGKPFFQASQNAVDQTGTVGKGSATTKTNLFKQKAGWKWQDAPEGHENTETIVSVEHRGKHFYALNAHFPKGVDLARYENATSEPRLRPTTQGNVTLGPQAGSISVRGKMHPVYHHVIVKADGGAVDAALALTRRFTKDGTGATLALKPKGK